MMIPVMTCAELAAMMGCAESTIEYRARRGLLPGLKFGPGWVFPTEVLLKRLNAEAMESAVERLRERGETTVTHTFSVGGDGRAAGQKVAPTLPDLTAIVNRMAKYGGLQ